MVCVAPSRALCQSMVSPMAPGYLRYGGFHTKRGAPLDLELPMTGPVVVPDAGRRFVGIAFAMVEDRTSFLAPWVRGDVIGLPTSFTGNLSRRMTPMCLRIEPAGEGAR
jgi:hypothetical protein